ncbi:MAG: ACT domain-containing protein [Clostridia bacterium]|nr:ACT domain-containing protein [Clostridia bacterium]
MKKAIISVIGKDKVGIIYGVTKILSENNVNVLDISQTIMQDMFTMMMIVDIENAKGDMSYLSDTLSKGGESLGVDIRIQLESIFESMHRI